MRMQAIPASAPFMIFYSYYTIPPVSQQVSFRTQIKGDRVYDNP